MSGEEKDDYDYDDDEKKSIESRRIRHKVESMALRMAKEGFCER